MFAGAQTYTVRDFMQKEEDIARSLEKIAAIGYKTVQISGIGPILPSRLKALCDQNDLRIVLTHSPEKRILTDTDRLIEEHRLYGAKYIGLGAMAERYRSAEGVDLFARDFTPAAQKMRDAGLRFMYHNHSFEFSRLPGGGTLMDALLDRMPQELMGITADTYWLQYGGMDVNEWLKSHPGRLQCVHFKDMSIHDYEQRMAVVGEGNIDFERITDTLMSGKTEYALVEQDDCYGEDPFDCLKRSYLNLKKLGYD